MASVAIVKCGSYDYQLIKDSIQKGINLLGGIEQFVSKNEKILLKPNILIGDAPAKCTTTHPLIVKATGELFLKQTSNVSYGDSPALGNTGRNAKTGGYQKVAEESGIRLADFKKGREITSYEAVQNKQFFIAEEVLDADGIISLCKGKTHGLTRMTGAVKNQFGCIPGLLKGEFHVKLPNIWNFSRMLVDLNMYIKPRLYIMDAVWAMEGNGPRGGKPYNLKVLLFSTDPIALDASFCRIIKMDPEIVPTLTCGSEAGAGTYKNEDIKILGESLESVQVDNFKAERSPVKAVHAGKFRRFLNSLLVPKPVIKPENCIKCGVCVNMCPTTPKSLYWMDKKDQPVYNYGNCIRCYCCQEMCPEDAIRQKKPLLRKLFSKKIKR